MISLGPAAALMAVSPLAVQYRRNWSRTTDGDHYVNTNSNAGADDQFPAILEVLEGGERAVERWPAAPEKEPEPAGAR